MPSTLFSLSSHILTTYTIFSSIFHHNKHSNKARFNNHWPTPPLFQFLLISTIKNSKHHTPPPLSPQGTHCCHFLFIQISISHERKGEQCGEAEATANTDTSEKNGRSHSLACNAFKINSERESGSDEASTSEKKENCVRRRGIFECVGKGDRTRLLPRFG